MAVTTKTFWADETDGTKICGCCEKILPIERFPAAGNTRDRLRSYCNSCAQIVKHGLSYNWYKAVRKLQKNRCALCLAPFSTTRKPHIDHDHDCCEGVYGCEKCFRGLLCFKCNNGLGSFGDSILVLERAIQYLKGTLE